jgi:polysaccharide export outer membrane protein
MRNFVGSITFAGILALQFCVAAIAQDQKSLGVTVQPAQTSPIGVGAAGVGTTAAKPGKSDGTGNPLLGGRRPLYRLNRSDSVMLSFTLSPEYDQTLTIQPDGYIMLRDAGPVFAQSLTLEELQDAVRKAYRGYLHDPQVAVALKDFEHPYFVAGGEVGRPGKYELRGDLNIMEAVEIAGGLTHDAKHSQVLLFRQVNEDVIEAHLFNLKRLLRGKGLGEVAELRPGDMIFVPQNALSKIEPFLTRPTLSAYVGATQF